jgi:hypothetical protein
MGLLGKLIGTALDVATSPIAVIKDAIPGAGGYIDGNLSHTGRKIEEVSDDLKEVREDIEDL